MSYVATLIAASRETRLTTGMIGAAAMCLPAAGTHVLARDVACDVLFEQPAIDDPIIAPLGERDYLERLRAGIAAALGGAPIDVVIQPAEGRRKRLFLADMDSTMIEQECIDELADFVGLKAEVSAITERAMRGELPFEPALRERVALLAGLPAGVVDEIVDQRLTLMPGGRELIATMRAHGTHCCLVSGGFTLFTGPVAAMLGFHEHRSNRLVIENGKLAGRVEEPILGREAKYATLIELRERLNLADHDTLAVGDGANDLAMLGEAGLGVAFRAKPAVAEAAAARIDHADLTALLYVQGYTEAEIVRP